MITPLPTSTTYCYTSESGAHTDSYLWATVERRLGESTPVGERVFDLGCGNGTLIRHLTAMGYDVSGVDPSEDGIKFAKEAEPDLPISLGSAYDPLHETYGTFPSVISLEVVEHVYYPRLFAQCVHSLLEPGGIAIISTPYHGYLKNLALALTGKMDRHFSVLWDHGHIKFWSIETLTALFAEQGMERIHIDRVGRFPLLAKSMILTFRKPLSTEPPKSGTH